MIGLRGPQGSIIRGLGFDYFDLLNASGIEDCDPHDSACVNRNTQRQVAVEDEWVNNYISNPATANLPTPTIHVQTDTSPAAMQAFFNNQPITGQTIAVGAGPSQSVAQLEKSPTVYKPQAVAPTPKTNAPAPAGSSSTPQGSPNLTSSLTLPTVGGFDLSSVPWWGWAGAAALGLFVLGGRK